MTWFVAIAIAVAMWWLTTVVALYRIGLPASTYSRTYGLATIVLLVGVVAVAFSLRLPTVLGAYLGFTGALLIWSWHELSYYLGFITGPAPRACPPNRSTVERFVHGVRASLHHELAIIATALLLFVMAWRAPNLIAFHTFCVLWLMRWSAKLNIFFGARNVHMEFLPSHLQYLATYMSSRSMNALFPFVMAAAVFVIYQLIRTAQDGSAYLVTTHALLATLLFLAILEHVLLMVKVPDGILWRLGTGSREANST
ncbi:MAG: putative photosynthetic complex assembly protein PuhE [Pseudomonadota bacterium]